MSTVIKIGGALLENPTQAAGAIQRFIKEPTVIVHGAGLQITRMMERMNVTPQFVDGLRVTDETTLKAVSLALLGEIHSQLVHSLQTTGLPAVGIVGSIRAHRKEGAWGFVGSSLEADPELLRTLLSIRRLPVVPTLGWDSRTLLNVNGDETAAAVAVSIRASRLIFMTDVPGVKDAEGATIISAPAVDELISAKFVSGGMVPKLHAVKAALSGGVPTVHVGQTVFGAAS